MRGSAWVAAAAAMLSACNSSGGDGNPADQAAANAASAKAAAPKHPTYCFYKDAATKAWSAKKDKSGNVTVKGKVFLEDTRYLGQLVQGEVEGEKAAIWLVMGTNTGYASPDNWWDVNAVIPNSASVKTVNVMCGTKTVASLPLKG